MPIVFVTHLMWFVSQEFQLEQGKIFANCFVVTIVARRLQRPDLSSSLWSPERFPIDDNFLVVGLNSNDSARVVVTVAIGL